MQLIPNIELPGQPHIDPPASPPASISSTSQHTHADDVKVGTSRDIPIDIHSEHSTSVGSDDEKITNCRLRARRAQVTMIYIQFIQLKVHRFIGLLVLSSVPPLLAPLLRLPPSLPHRCQIALQLLHLQNVMRSSRQRN